MADDILLGHLIFPNSKFILTESSVIPTTAIIERTKPTENKYIGFIIKTISEASATEFNLSYLKPKEDVTINTLHITSALTDDGENPHTPAYRNRTIKIIEQRKTHGIRIRFNTKYKTEYITPICKPDTANICATPP